MKALRKLANRMWGGKLSTWLVLCLCFFLSGCITDIWTGATVLYDRHNLYKKFDDFHLDANIRRALYRDMQFKLADCSIDLAVFNGDVLLAGYVPTEELREEANKRVTEVGGYRRLFNQLAVSRPVNTAVKDDWITAKVRSRIFADSSIDPKQFKVVTSLRVVYLMGDVIPTQAEKVIGYARECAGVRRVVKLFKYYNLSDQPQ